MRVTVRLFARLREAAGTSDIPLQLASGSTVNDVWQALVNRHPDLEPFRRSVTCAVNADFSTWTTIVQEGDEIAFLPPVSGG